MAIISRIINSLDVIFNKQLLDSDSIIRQLYVINSDEKRGEYPKLLPRKKHCPDRERVLKKIDSSGHRRVGMFWVGNE
jgi:hypothetical protein